MQLIKWYTGQRNNNTPSGIHILLWLDNEPVDKETYKDLYEIIKYNKQFELVFDNNIRIHKSSEKLAIVITLDYTDDIESTSNDFIIIADGINKLVDHFNKLKETKDQDETVI